MTEIINVVNIFKFNSTLFASSTGFMNNSWLLLQYYYFVITLILIVGIPIWFNQIGTMTFSLHQGWVVMSSQIKQTHSHQDTPLSPYT